MENNPRNYKRQKITKEIETFSLNELKDVCYRLGINYEDLPGYTNSSRVDLGRELHMHMGRRGKLTELYDELRKYKRDKNLKKNKKTPKRRKSKEETYSDMAILLNRIIFTSLNKWVNIAFMFLLVCFSLVAAYHIIYQLSLFNFLIVVSISILIVLILFICVLKWLIGPHIRIEARRQKFYDLTKLKRDHSKDKLHEILNENYKPPTLVILRIISSACLWTDLKNKR